MLSIEISNQQCRLEIDSDRLRRVVEAVLRDAGIADAALSIAVVDDPTIHALNRQYLAHDYPTDVLSFTLAQEPGRLEGEVIVSADTALLRADEFGWPADDELLLYAIHGTLHLVGHDDVAESARAEMRSAEARYLRLVGLGSGRTPGAA